MPLFRRFGRPGLIGLAARTAVVAGTATAVSGGLRRRQEENAIQQQERDQYEAQQQSTPHAQPAPAEPVFKAQAAEGNFIDELEKLSALHSQGALSDSEFAYAKSKLLN